MGLKNIFKVESLLVKKEIDGYILPSTDEYMNEYVPEYNQRLKWLTGFTGSNGFFLMIKKKYYFFTDGRYILQAKNEIDKNIKILNISDKSFLYWLSLNIFKRKLCIDSKINRIVFIKKLKAILKSNENKLVINSSNLIDKVWIDRTFDEPKKIFFLPKTISGISSQDKIKKIKKKFQEYDFLFLTSPESIAWLLNIRGGDLKYSPLVFCRLIIDKNEKIYLFLPKNNLLEKNFKKFEKFNYISIFKEDDLKDFLKKKITGKSIVLDINSPYFFYKLIKINKAKLELKTDPCSLEKSKKNNIEISLSKENHLNDAVAMCKFFYWLKNNKKIKSISEYSAAQKLENFRRENKGFISLSFPTISAVGSNGAIIHYKPNEFECKFFNGQVAYLCDSGAQYLGATTDITRTIFIGNKKNIPKQFKEFYTRVLIGHISISSLIFPKGTTGMHIDSLARRSLWDVGADYSHGTGHGVGSFLNVHEGPQSISKSINSVELEPGMILSNEPGYYEEGKYGIRLENLIYVKKSKKENFLEFENLTLYPFEIDLIDKKFLNLEQILWVNNYHKKVYKKLNPVLEYDLRNWLKLETREI